MFRKQDQRWSTEEEAQLVCRYPDAQISFAELEAYFGRSRGSIVIKAQRMGLHRPRSDGWSEQEIADLQQVYANPQTSPAEMEAFFGRSWQAIQCRARKLGLRRRDVGVVHDYFAVLDTAQKAYDLGFLAADGSVEGDYRVQLELCAADRPWLEAMRNRLAPGASITPHRKNFQFNLRSRQMVQDLAQWGIIPNKSKRLRFPPVPAAIILPFLLGYFDGDGCLHQLRGKENHYQWYMVGTYAFLATARTSIQQFCGIELGEPARVHRLKSPHLYRIRTAGQQVFVLDRVLNASGLGMPRKHLG